MRKAVTTLPESGTRLLPRFLGNTRPSIVTLQDVLLTLTRPHCSCGSYHMKRQEMNILRQLSLSPCKQQKHKNPQLINRQKRAGHGVCRFTLSILICKEASPSQFFCNAFYQPPKCVLVVLGNTARSTRRDRWDICSMRARNTFAQYLSTPAMQAFPHWGTSRPEHRSCGGESGRSMADGQCWIGPSFWVWQRTYQMERCSGRLHWHLQSWILCGQSFSALAWQIHWHWQDWIDSIFHAWVHNAHTLCSSSTERPEGYSTSPSLGRFGPSFQLLRTWHLESFRGGFRHSVLYKLFILYFHEISRRTNAWNISKD